MPRPLSARLLALEDRLTPSTLAEVPDATLVVPPIDDTPAPVASTPPPAAAVPDDVTPLVAATTVPPVPTVPLDSGFDGDGLADLTPGADFGLEPTVAKVIGLADGRTLTLASFRYDWFVERRTAAGRPDPTFGTNGRVFLYVSNAPLGAAFIEGPPIGYTDLAATADGGAVAVGTEMVGIGSAFPPANLLVAKLTAAGQRDATFEANAAAAVAGGFGPDADGRVRAAGVVAVPDGLLIAGTGTADNDLTGTARVTRAGVLKLRTDGTRDTAFGTDGAVTLDGSAGITPGVPDGGPLAVAAVGLAADATGRPLLLGTSRPTELAVPAVVGADDGTRPFVARFTRDGRPDTTFAGDGTADLRAPARAFDPNDAPATRGESQVTAFGLTVAGEGVVVGLNDRRAFDTQSYLLRLTAAGTPDAGFGPAGFAAITDTRGLSDMAAAADGSILAVTAADTNRNPAANTMPIRTTALYRVTAAGRLQPLGEVGPDEPPVARRGQAVAIDPNGRVTVGLSGSRVGTAATDPLVQLARLADAEPVPTVTALAGGANGTLTRLFRDADGKLASAGEVAPFDGFAGPVRGLTADLNGDGAADLIFATGPGGGSRVRVQLGGTPTSLPPAPFEFTAFEGTFTGGVFLAVGDLTGDGRPDLIVTPDVGGGPVVAVFDGAQTVTGLKAVEVRRFLGIDDPNFRGGARAAAGDVDGDGRADLIVAAGVGGGPRVAIYDGETVLRTPARLRADFFAFPGEDATRLRNGATVAAGDLTGDGKAELVFGSGLGGAPRVRVLSGESIRADFFAEGNVSSRAGSNVAVRDGQLLVGASGKVRAYTAATLTPAAEPPTDGTVEVAGDPTAGVFVG